MSWFSVRAARKGATMSDSKYLVLESEWSLNFTTNHKSTHIGRCMSTIFFLNAGHDERVYFSASIQCNTWYCSCSTRAAQWRRWQAAFHDHCTRYVLQCVTSKEYKYCYRALLVQSAVPNLVLATVDVQESDGSNNSQYQRAYVSYYCIADCMYIIILPDIWSIRFAPLFATSSFDHSEVRSDQSRRVKQQCQK